MLYFAGIVVSWNTSLNKNKNPPVNLKITVVPGPSTRKEVMENDAVPFHFSNSLSTSHVPCEDDIIAASKGAVTFLNLIKLHRQKSPLTIVSSVAT